MTNQWPRRRNRPVFAIPNVPEPENVRCVTLYVPDNLDHLAALNGALRILCSAANWANDDAHNAKKCADLWASLLEEHPVTELGDCEMTPIFRQSGDCTLQVSYDGGIVWDDIFNAQVCADNAVQQGIQDAIDDGIIGVPGQPGPDGTLPPVIECRTYNFEISGNDRWLLPVPVKDGYTIQVHDLSGGWYDGGVLYGPNWRCPDGRYYIGGACEDDTYVYDDDDPLPDVPHMQVVVNAGTWFSAAIDSVAVVPSDEGELINAFLQANDSVLSDNEGSIRGKVTVCSGENCGHGWTTTIFNFTGSTLDSHVEVYSSQGVFVPFTGIDSTFAYVAPNSYQVSFITASWTNSVPIRQVIIHYEMTAGVLEGVDTRFLYDDDSSGPIAHEPIPNGVSYNVFEMDRTSTGFTLESLAGFKENVDSNPGGLVRLTKIVVCTEGAID